MSSWGTPPVPEELLRWLQQTGSRLGTPDGWELSACWTRLQYIRVAASRILEQGTSVFPALRATLWPGDGTRRRCTLATLNRGAARALAGWAGRQRPGQRSAELLGAQAAAATLEQRLPAGGAEHLWCPQTAAAERSVGTQRWRAAILRLGKDDLEAHGGFEVVTRVCAVANSAGVATWHRHTAAEWCITAAHSAGRVGRATARRRSLGQLDSEALTEEAAARCLLGPTWAAPPRGPCRALLEPPAVAALVAAALEAPDTALAGDQDGAGLLSELLLPVPYSLTPPLDAPGCAADASGRLVQARTPTGSLLNELTDTSPGAALDGGTPRLPWYPGAQVAAGDVAPPELARVCDAGVWLSGLGGAAAETPGPSPAALRAWTRGGTFVVQGGRLGHRCSEAWLRVPAESLRSVVAIGRERDALPWPGRPGGTLVVPAVVLAGVELVP